MGREGWERGRALTHAAAASASERIIPELDPDLVVVIQRAVDDPDFEFLSIAEDPDADDPVRWSAARALDALADLDQPVAIIESIPVVSIDRDPLKCMSVAVSLAECRYVASEGATPLEQFYEERDADDDDVYVVNIDEAVCPYFPICDPVVDGMVTKWDSTHLTTTYARAISPQIEAALDAVGALP